MWIDGYVLITYNVNCNVCQLIIKGENIMNKLILTGRLVNDPELNRKGDSVVARYTIAVQRDYKKEGEPDCDFLPCICFGKTAEFVDRFLRKGIKVGVEGKVRTGNYVNKEGKKVYFTDVIVNTHEFLESKKDD